jgi:hypothetical protein
MKGDAFLAIVLGWVEDDESQLRLRQGGVLPHSVTPCCAKT